MTPAELKAVAAFAPVRMVPGTADKRFIRMMLFYRNTNPEGYTLYEKQRDYLKRLVQRYRRQIPDWETLKAELESEDGSLL